LGKNGKFNIDLLLNLKKKKLVNKVGISIYDPKELKKIWNIWRPDLVQAPLNVFDHRIYKSGWLNKLKRRNVEVHVRSCFLQGILINYNVKNKFYNKFKKWKKLFYNWSSWCEANKISKLEACLNFIKNFKNIDYLIIGVENSKQLKEIIKIFRSKKKNIPHFFACNDAKLIEPKNWK
tara:strand:- start:156 stop:689 length:534 start_codon:yes stop_codon:yes gene_type:complete